MSTRRSLTTAMLLCLATSACGTTASGGGTDDSDDGIVVAGVSILTADPYFITMRCGAEEAADRLGVELRWDGSTSADVAPQQAVLQAMELRNPDAFVFTPFSQDAYLSDVTRLMEAGKPVVLADATMAEHVFYEGHQSDNESAGQQIADYLADQVGGAGPIGLIALAPGNPIDEARYVDLPELLANRAPDLQILDPEFANGEASAAAEIASGLIQAHPDLRAIYATNGPQATGAASAIRAAGKAGDIALIGYSAEPAQVESLKQGEIDALLAQSPFLIGQRSVEAAVTYVQEHPDGGSVSPAEEPYRYTPTLLITPENVDDPATDDFVFTTC